MESSKPGSLEKLRPSLEVRKPSTFLQGFCNSTLKASETGRFAGKVVVITGGASGIGEATTRLFVSHGAHVVIADIDQDRGQKLSDELGTSNSCFLKCDVTKEKDVAALVDQTMLDKGKLDIYFSNAGFVGALGAIDKLQMEDFDATLAVNLRGTVLGFKHAARVMKPMRRGVIVCTGSSASKLAGFGPHTYCISKTALEGLVKSTALELRDFGIRVNMVSPDATATPLFSRVLENSKRMQVSLKETKEYLTNRSLLPGRALTDMDVANAVLFLGSDEAGYISGHNLLLDAARTVSMPYPEGYKHWFYGHSEMLK
ncbi:hypothetical protein BDL97_17G083600 [Sphagnum fallax]|nr:hypothetical protein BDL97_17G083600 [Sphagnum fallax]